MCYGQSKMSKCQSAVRHSGQLVTNPLCFHTVWLWLQALMWVPACTCTRVREQRENLGARVPFLFCCTSVLCPVCGWVTWRPVASILFPGSPDLPFFLWHIGKGGKSRGVLFWSNVCAKRLCCKQRQIPQPNCSKKLLLARQELCAPGAVRSKYLRPFDLVNW